jgi:hypothetical protein
LDWIGCGAGRNRHIDRPGGLRAQQARRQSIMAKFYTPQNEVYGIWPGPFSENFSFFFFSLFLFSFFSSFTLTILKNVYFKKHGIKLFKFEKNMV